MTLVLALAANTSFGGLPVLMNLLAPRSPPAALVLPASRTTGVSVWGGVPGGAGGFAAHRGRCFDHQTHPAIHHRRFRRLYHQPGRPGAALACRPGRRAGGGESVLNGTGAAMTSVAVAVFVFSKFLEGAWVVVLTISGPDAPLQPYRKVLHRGRH